ncbi:uncharacterized protein LOC116787095 [Chiroxiphia lanceolata]|uniref:uncharacterized protein LOC116787095 n=1 Tax=Chiroxiphia lanceolata TaxID=296741 RepID=UPI0013CF325A|nr:uncharacterized protein LOC116787095 [Chiroxiphia lanceolata]
MVISSSSIEVQPVKLSVSSTLCASSQFWRTIQMMSSKSWFSKSVLLCRLPPGFLPHPDNSACTDRSRCAHGLNSGSCNSVLYSAVSEGCATFFSAPPCLSLLIAAKQTGPWCLRSSRILARTVPFLGWTGSFVCFVSAFKLAEPRCSTGCIFLSPQRPSAPHRRRRRTATLILRLLRGCCRLGYGFGNEHPRSGHCTAVPGYPSAAGRDGGGQDRWAGGRPQPCPCARLGRSERPLPAGDPEPAGAVGSSLRFGTRGVGLWRRDCGICHEAVGKRLGKLPSQEQRASVRQLPVVAGESCFGSHRLWVFGSFGKAFWMSCQKSCIWSITTAEQRISLGII